MDPSGSSKMSLLKILAGKIVRSTKLSLHREIRIDSEVVESTNISIRKQIANGEQDVSILAMCTPREDIAFSAHLRLDKQLTNAQINNMVNGILDKLGLQHVTNVLIAGGPLMVGGLSGGKKNAPNAEWNS